MKYLKKFDSTDDYNAYTISDDYITPNVSLIGSVILKYNPVYTPMYIEALEDLTVKMSSSFADVYYSEDLVNWERLANSSSSSNIINITKGKKTYFYSNGSAYNPGYGIGTFVITGKCNVGGNCMSLRYGLDYKDKKTFTSYAGFQSLFADCTTIINAKNLILPATTLLANTYNRMFANCTSLKTAPLLLPATTVTTRKSGNNKYPTISGAYESMFEGCTSLVTAPEILAETIGEQGCYNMFKNCTSLEYISMAPIKTFTSSHYNKLHLSQMFANCASLKNAPELPATTLAEQCYDRMFMGCTSLTTAPELPATTLKSNCYVNMFYGCTKLNYIKAMFTTAPSFGASSWVSGVASTGTFVKNAAATWDVTGVNGIPSGWTVKLYDPDTDKYVIKFTIDGTSYKAEEGATWVDWVASTYNTAGFTVSGTSILSSDGGTVVLSDVAVISTDAITSGGVYTIQTATA